MEIIKARNCLTLSHVVQPYYDFHIEEFENIFNKVFNFNYMEYFHSYGYKAMEDQIINIIEKEKIEYVIVWQWYANYVPMLEFLQSLRKKVFVVLWLFDDDVFFHSHGKFYAQVCDVVVTSDYFGKIMYEQLNIPSIYYLSAYDKKQYKPIEIVKDIDVSFVGGLDKADRREYIEYLEQNGIDVEVYGPGSKNGYVTFEEMVNIFNRSKINLNFTKIGFLKNIYEANPLISRVRQNKGRPVEIGLCRTLCLTESAPPLKYIFDIGNELDTFNNKEEMLEKIRYYLSNEQERERRAENLYQTCLSQYEKDKYFPNIFKQLEKVYKNKNIELIDYYPIERNKFFIINEKAFFLKNSLRALVKKRNYKVFLEGINFVFRNNYFLIVPAMIEIFKKYHKGESK